MLFSTEALIVVALHLEQLLEVNFTVDLALKSGIGTSTVVCARTIHNHVCAHNNGEINRERLVKE